MHSLSSISRALTFLFAWGMENANRVCKTWATLHFFRICFTLLSVEWIALSCFDWVTHIKTVSKLSAHMEWNHSLFICIFPVSIFRSGKKKDKQFAKVHKRMPQCQSPQANTYMGSKLFDSIHGFPIPRMKRSNASYKPMTYICWTNPRTTERCFSSEKMNGRYDIRRSMFQLTTDEVVQRKKCQKPHTAQHTFPCSCCCSESTGGLKTILVYLFGYK